MISSSIYKTHSFDREFLHVAQEQAYLGKLSSYKNSWGFIKFFACAFGWAIDIKIGKKIQTVSRADYIEFFNANSTVKVDKTSVYQHTNLTQETFQPQTAVKYIRDQLDQAKRQQLTNKFYQALGDYDSTKAMKYAGRGANINFTFLTYENQKGEKFIKKEADLYFPDRNQEEDPENVGESAKTVYTRYNPAMYATTCAEAQIIEPSLDAPPKDIAKHLADLNVYLAEQHRVIMQKLDKEHKRTMQNLNRQMQQSTIKHQQEMHAIQVQTRQIQEASDLLVNAMDPSKPIPKREAIASVKEPEALYAYSPDDAHILKEKEGMKALAQFLIKLGQTPSGTVLSRKVTRGEDSTKITTNSTIYLHNYEITESVEAHLSVGEQGTVITTPRHASQVKNEQVADRIDKKDDFKKAKPKFQAPQYTSGLSRHLNKDNAIKATGNFMRAGAS